MFMMANDGYVAEISGHSLSPTKSYAEGDSDNLELHCSLSGAWSVFVDLVF